MYKILCVLAATALVIEGSPAYQSGQLEEAVRNGNWDLFQSLFQQSQNFGSGLSGSVESLKPDGNNHVFGQSVSTFKEWHNDNGKVESKSGGLEITNNDGQITRRVFQP